MNEDAKRLVERLSEVNQIIARFDETIRRDVFALLVPLVLGKTEARQETTEQGNPDLSSFFTVGQSDTPANTVHRVIAFLYARSGPELSLSDIREVAADVGLTLPERLDVTVSGAQRSGKPLYRSLGKGGYRVTVHGASFLEAEYHVKRGRAQAAREED